MKTLKEPSARFDAQKSPCNNSVDQHFGEYLLPDDATEIFLSTADLNHLYSTLSLCIALAMGDYGRAII